MWRRANDGRHRVAPVAHCQTTSPTRPDLVCRDLSVSVCLACRSRQLPRRSVWAWQKERTARLPSSHALTLSRYLLVPAAPPSIISKQCPSVAKGGRLFSLLNFKHLSASPIYRLRQRDSLSCAHSEAFVRSQRTSNFNPVRSARIVLFPLGLPMQCLCTYIEYS